MPQVGQITQTGGREWTLGTQLGIARVVTINTAATLNYIGVWARDHQDNPPLTTNLRGALYNSSNVLVAQSAILTQNIVSNTVFNVQRLTFSQEAIPSGNYILVVTGSPSLAVASGETDTNGIGNVTYINSDTFDMFPDLPPIADNITTGLFQADATRAWDVFLDYNVITGGGGSTISSLTKQSLITIQQRVLSANSVLREWAESNTYIGIGRQSNWNGSDDRIDLPDNRVDYTNSVWRNLIALKKITAADMALVVPRIDWQTGETYFAYDSDYDVFSTTLGVGGTGTVSATATSRTVSGIDTKFLLEYTSGDLIQLPGDGVGVAPQIRQVIDIFSNTSMNVNTAFGAVYAQNAHYRLTDTSPLYARSFYVRNSYDQVFKCLSNNKSAVSTSMPTITIGGQLPENAFIETDDGYKWKYLYTIPSGQKRKFFDEDWMPVYSDPAVVAATVDGAIDIVHVQAGGQGYNQNVASNTAAILSVVGDGTGANLTAKVYANGQIFGVNVLDGGRDYTFANVVVAVTGSASGANLNAVIGPQGGHGFSPREELGAKTLMLSLELDSDENGTIPTEATVGDDDFDYRQISVIQNPKLSEGPVASNTNYSTVTTINTQGLPAGQFFRMDEVVYQGDSLEEATFIATVVFWDSISNILHLNNVIGSFTALAPIRGTQMTTPVTAFQLVESVVEPYTGRLLYIHNVLPVVRSVDQIEQIKLILTF